MSLKKENKSEQVISFLQKEITCYDSLLVKMKKQKEAIANGDEPNLLKIIQETDQLIETIQKLDKEIEQAFNKVPETERESLAKRLGTLKEQIHGFLNQILILENACRDILEDQKSKISYQIKTLREGKNLMGKYQSNFPKGSSFSKDI